MPVVLLYELPATLISGGGDALAVAVATRAATQTDVRASTAKTAAIPCLDRGAHLEPKRWSFI